MASDRDSRPVADQPESREEQERAQGINSDGVGQVASPGGIRKDVTRPPARAGTRSVGHRAEPSG